MSDSEQRGRQRLRPWLIAQINGGQIPGLCWVDDEKTKFKIPWKHRGRQDWQPMCGQIYMEWAKQTGSYREGVDEPDYVKWKTRLRCALHKAQDIDYIENESRPDETLPEPYRVYQFKPSSERTRRSVNDCPSQSGISLQTIATCMASSRTAPVPTVVETINDVSGSGSLPSDLNDIHSAELLLLDVQSSTMPPPLQQQLGHDVTAMTVTTADLINVGQLTDSLSSMTMDTSSSEITLPQSMSVPTAAPSPATAVHDINYATHHYVITDIINPLVSATAGQQQQTAAAWAGLNPEDLRMCDVDMSAGYTT